jgi:hypothetical protein
VALKLFPINLIWNGKMYGLMPLFIAQFLKAQEGINMKNNHLRKLSSSLVAVSFAFVAVTSQAATVIFEDGSTTNAIGIDGLITGGVEYDVTFDLTTAELLYGPEPLEFQFDTQVSSQTALQDVILALNDTTAVTVGPREDPDFSIAFSLTPSLVKVNVKKGDYSSGPPLNVDAWITGEEGEALSFGSIATYADFQEVPEPSMGLLSGSALLCLAGIRRSRSA